MKEITILSGKGGTGKTSITSAFASCAKKAVFCDNDVDAADLHLIFDPQIKERFVFEGAYLANIDSNKCTQCNICVENCRYDAIDPNDFVVNAFRCEGCRLCERLCPEEAITSEKSLNNHWFISDSRFGKLVHAKMGAGEENSGKLVSEVRKAAKQLAIDTNADMVINDGPPGIGCAAISSITGTNAVMLVAEPSKSGLHDMQRLIELVNSFNIPAFAIINKSDLSKELTSELEKLFEDLMIPLLAKVPFNENFVHSMIQGKNIVEYDEQSEIAILLKNAWGKFLKHLNN